MQPAAILIPNHDGTAWLTTCLESLLASIPPAVRVLVIDNGSTDGGPARMRERFPRIECLELERNIGFARAMNLGLLSTRRQGARWLILLNNDTRLPVGWFETLARAAERHPEYALLGPCQRDFQGVDSPRTRAILAPWGASPGSQARSSIPEVVPTDWIEGSCLAVRADVFDKVGFLDPLFSPAYFEELDFCRRARRHGFHAGLVTTSHVLHHGGATAARRPRRARSTRARNYLLYHGAWAGQRGLAILPRLVARAVRHGIKEIGAGRLAPRDWLRAVRDLPRHWDQLLAKVARERAGWPCAATGDRLRQTGAQVYFEECVRRLVSGESLARGGDR